MKKIRHSLLYVALLFGGILFSSCEVDLDDLIKQQNLNGYVITVRSADYNRGYAGLFMYMEGSQIMCRIEAIAYDGYHFSNWNDSIYETPHTFAVNKSENFTAYFERD